MRKRYSSRFFDRPTLTVAKDLLGKFLVRRFPRRSALSPRGSARREATAMITEVEAYVGPNDKASHASRGRTERNKVMFGKPGRWYIYMVYGMHYCLNIVTEKENYPAAILIRSVAPQSDTYQRSRISVRKGKCGSINGPGKVCRHFRIDKKINGCLANKKTGLWIEDRGVKIIPRRIRRGKRVGVDYAGEWKEKLWRFYLGQLAL